MVTERKQSLMVVKMPILLKEVHWSETNGSVSIRIEMRNVNKKNVSIMSASRYLKVSNPPFLWEAFLKGSIKVSESVTRIGNDKITFVLNKEEKGLWGSLNDAHSEDKPYCQKLRREALSEIETITEENWEKKKDEKSKRDKMAVTLQMSIEEEERKRIQQIKDNERQTAAKEIEQLFGLSCKGTEINEKDYNKKLITNKTTRKAKESFLPLPPPRTTGYVNVEFTPREFPTSARESRKEEEDEWLRKQTEARKSIDLECADLHPEEKNPVWLKDKGDDFYSKGDYVAAINAYSLALKLCPNLPSLYSNRAACHLQCQNLEAAIEDTSRALHLLTPAVKSNSGARMKCHIRRGTAFCALEMYIEGLQDYEEALKIDPRDVQLQQDTQKIRKIIQGEAV